MHAPDLRISTNFSGNSRGAYESVLEDRIRKAHQFIQVELRSQLDVLGRRLERAITKELRREPGDAHLESEQAPQLSQQSRISRLSQQSRMSASMSKISHISATSVSSGIHASGAWSPAPSFTTSEAWRTKSYAPHNQQLDWSPRDGWHMVPRPATPMRQKTVDMMPQPSADSADDDLRATQRSTLVIDTPAFDLSRDRAHPEHRTSYNLVPDGSQPLGGEVVTAPSRTDSEYAPSVRRAATFKSIRERMQSHPGASREQRCVNRKAFLPAVVESTHFNIVVAVLIIVNAAAIGAQVDCMARYWREPAPSFFHPLNLFLCAFFTIEISLRIIVYGCDFFTGRMWKFNVFDCVIVAYQVLHEAISNFERVPVVHWLGVNLSMLRILRVLRLIRVLKLLNLVEASYELRMLLISIAGSMQTLIWTLVVLFLFTYVFGVCLTEFVSHWIINNKEEEEARLELQVFYGSLAQTMLTLYQTISDGIHWREAMEPLVRHVSPNMSVVFVVYIAFALFALLNIVTGIFVESATRTAQLDKVSVIGDQIQQLFSGADADDSGMISWYEFQHALNHDDQMFMYLRALDLHPAQARQLFYLLDTDGSGEINRDEFTHGLERLQGDAKAIDFASFMAEWEMISGELVNSMDCIIRISEYLDKVAPREAQPAEVSAPPSMAPDFVTL